MRQAVAERVKDIVESHQRTHQFFQVVTVSLKDLRPP